MKHHFIMDTLFTLALETLFSLVEVGVILFLIVLSIRALMSSGASSDHSELKVTHLNEQLRQRAVWLKRMLMSPEEREVAARLEARSEKSEHRQKKRQAKREAKREAKEAKRDLKHKRAESSSELSSDLSPERTSETAVPPQPESAVEVSVEMSTDDSAERPAESLGDIEAVVEAPAAAHVAEGSEGQGVLSQADQAREELDAPTAKVADPIKPRLFVVKFKGDIQASAVEDLREEITSILQVKRSEDEVLLCLHNSGGYVHTHGLAASQLTRLTSAGIRLTVAIDQVAASGGYMMACVGERIIAAPFAIVGSIGVVAQVPNINRLLKRYDVDVELHTAGDYKRTLTMLGENTDEGREKFIEELHKTHRLFQDFVKDQRPALDIDKVATGETWYGTSAVEIGLIDEVKTSDEMMLSSVDTHDIYLIEHQRKRKPGERISAWVSSLLHGQIPGL